MLPSATSLIASNCNFIWRFIYYTFELCIFDIMELSELQVNSSHCTSVKRLFGCIFLLLCVFGITIDISLFSLTFFSQLGFHGLPHGHGQLSPSCTYGPCARTNEYLHIHNKFQIIIKLGFCTSMQSEILFSLGMSKIYYNFKNSQNNKQCNHYNIYSSQQVFMFLK